MKGEFSMTAKDIRNALIRKFPDPEWYLGFEVGNSTGSACRRHADAVAVNAYPSKGFETRGFEIKVSKGDLKNELDKGIKSDEIARFCDYWFLVTPKGLTKDFTLPPTWGVLECLEDGTLKQVVKPQKLEKQDPTPGFLCAVLRGRERYNNERAKESYTEMEQDIRRKLSWERANAQRDLDKLKTILREVKDKTGIDINTWTIPDHVANKLKAAALIEDVAFATSTINYSIGVLAEEVERLQKLARNNLKEV
jgi:hypothetical protein